MSKISVLIVDDSFFMRKVIGDILRGEPDIEVVGEASNGAEALEKIAELQPRVVTLDLEMPILNGLEALRSIVKMPRPPAVVIVSGYVEEGAAVTLECLALGAVDFVLKPQGSFSIDLEGVKELLITKVRAAAEAGPSKLHTPSAPAERDWRYKAGGGVMVIGASTGGPPALEALLSQFPDSFPYPIVVAQHLPKSFAASFADRLRRRCQLDVTRAEQDTKLKPGTIYIAVGGTTTTIRRESDELSFDVHKNNHDIETPRISQLMISAAEACGDKTVGVILTGMGRDGLDGMEQIKKAGGKTVVQDEATSAVYGMGREVVQKGLADAVVPLGQIAKTVNQELSHG
jgi:two-component system chemotaxis response regulator CheB